MPLVTSLYVFANINPYTVQDRPSELAMGFCTGVGSHCYIGGVGRGMDLNGW